MTIPFFGIKGTNELGQVEEVPLGASERNRARASRDPPSLVVQPEERGQKGTEYDVAGGIGTTGEGLKERLWAYDGERNQLIDERELIESRRSGRQEYV